MLTAGTCIERAQEIEALLFRCCDPDARQRLLNLAIQWREIAAIAEQNNDWLELFLALEKYNASEN